MAEAYLVKRDNVVLNGILTRLERRAGKRRAGKQSTGILGTRERVGILNRQVQDRNKKEDLRKQALLIQAAAQGLVEIQTVVDQYHVSCPGGCLTLTNRPWKKEFGKRRTCQQCSSTFQVERAWVRRPQLRVINRTTDVCRFCKHQYRSDADFVVHSLMGECAESRVDSHN